jgi:hypothetical protein
MTVSTVVAAPPTIASTPTSIGATVVNEAAALRALQQRTLGAISSGPVSATGGDLAVIASGSDPSGSTATIYRFVDGQWQQRESLRLDNPVLPGGTITHADVTGDGEPDFLVPQAGATNIFGSVISAQTRAWQTVPFQYGSHYQRSEPQLRFVGTHVVSTTNNCVPDCAHGSTQDLNWVYAPGGPTGGYFFVGQGE